MTENGPSRIVFAALEALLGAGVSVAPMEGATLLRHLPRLADDWAGGLHLDQAPTGDDIGQWLSSWEAFEAPGRMRWVTRPDRLVEPAVTAACEAAGYEVSSRPVVTGVPAQADPPASIELRQVEDDPRDWAGFEALARWIDLDEDPDVWRWRANRVRHLVEGGFGEAWLARTSIAPVAAAVRLRPRSYRGEGTLPIVAVVVHQAHRGRGLASAMLAEAADGGEVVVLGQSGRLLGLASTLGMDAMGVLTEVHRPSTWESKA